MVVSHCGVCCQQAAATLITGSLPARAYIFSHITSRFFFAAAVSNSINGNAL